MKQRERNDFTGFTCDTCNTKFEDDHELQAHKKARHAANSSQGGEAHSTVEPSTKKPGIEPADHRETTELPPGAKKARTGGN